ncbi:Hypothetical protein Cp267_1693 [Corynebacterium pseudotuberculosis 267]|nr:Hypothetical protein Cp4202_1618 [Corynebacterium pseudotuberculosis 42/02-A]AFH52577.1 Hypothetical protein Cp267_1693 [Corynebacterium pseudotuberculosis 267]
MVSSLTVSVSAARFRQSPRKDNKSQARWKRIPTTDLTQQKFNLHHIKRNK